MILYQPNLLVHIPKQLDIKSVHFKGSSIPEYWSVRNILAGSLVRYGIYNFVDKPMYEY